MAEGFASHARLHTYTCLNPWRHGAYQPASPHLPSHYQHGNINPFTIGYLRCSKFALGPANPLLISIAEETLGFRWPRISLDLRLLIPTFSLPEAPPSLASTTSAPRERSPTSLPNFYGNWRGTASSVLHLSPVTFSAHPFLSPRRRE